MSKCLCANETDNQWGPSEGAVRTLAGEFGDSVLAIWKDDVTAFFMGSDPRRHVWYAWLSQHRAAAAEGTWTKLAFTKSRNLLADAFGLAPVGMLGALGKLGPVALPKGFYPALVRVLLAGGEPAKYIHHATTLQYEDVVAIDSANGKLDPKAVVELIRTPGITSKNMRQLVWVIERLRSARGELAGTRVLGGNAPLQVIQDELSAAPFPSPPIDLGEACRPVRSFTELKEAAQRYQNCLQDADRLWTTSLNIQNGRLYLYEYGNIALLSFVRFGEVGWALREARGVRNQVVAQEVKAAIMRSVEMNEMVSPTWTDEGTLPLFDTYLYDWGF